MRIRTDVNQILSQKGYVPSQRMQSTPNIHTPHQNPLSDRQLMKSLSDNLSRERALSDALTIAQTSQNLLQKAMVVSSRLRTIAAQAMTSGRVDTSSLQNALSEIQVTMQSHGQHISTPPSTDSRNLEIPEIPSISESVNSTIDSGTRTLQGNLPEPQMAEVLNQNLENRSSAMNEVITQIQGQMSELSRQLPGQNNIDIPATVNTTRDLITTSPEEAIFNQGNINPLNAQRIINS